jgi:hypothetical protein
LAAIWKVLRFTGLATLDPSWDISRILLREPRRVGTGKNLEFRLSADFMGYCARKLESGFGGITNNSGMPSNIVEWRLKSLFLRFFFEDGFWIVDAIYWNNGL